VSREIPDSGLEKIHTNFDTEVWNKVMPPTEEQIIENSKDCEGLVSLLSDDLNQNIINNLPKLKIIAQYAVGYDNIDIQAASKRRIIVTNTPGVLTETTADLTWALILAASRRVVEADKFVRRGQWKVAWSPKLLLGSDIHNATLGIIGLGRIGAAVARRASGFSMKIMYTSRSENEISQAVERETNAERVDFTTLLRQADIISVHVPLTTETYKLIGKDEFSMMKSNAILINTSRGPIIDENALYEALSSHQIRAAGLDVFTIEPISEDSTLLELENVVLLPHIGSASTATRDRMADMVAENLIAFKRNEIPPNIVNPEVLDNE